MLLRHILAAADNSEEGRAAITAAARLGQRSGARVTVLTVAHVARGDGVVARLVDRLRDTVDGQLAALDPPHPTVDLAVELGLPGIEIGRFAETSGANLIVVGRKRRTSMQRLLIGDTADSVARRSPIPCFFVQAGDHRFSRLLVGLDGTERGLAVLPVAMDFARDAHARLRVITVEPVYDNEREAPWLHTGRSARLAEAIDSLRNRSGPGQEAWDTVLGTPGESLVVHRGRVVEEILKALHQSGTDVLILGCHRGGPAGVIEAGSIARRLMHECPCAVLTVPL
jgi:nucleotide-binding universal stress UspA family protein